MSCHHLRGPWAAAALAVLLAPAPAPAFNPETIFLSPEAALGGGAVLAGDDEGGAGRYNPASLGGLQRSSVQLGASAYSVTAARVDDALFTELPWQALHGDASDSSFGSVPAVLALTWLVRPGLGLSAGIWTPYHGTQAATIGGRASGPYPDPAYPDLQASYEQSYSWNTSRDDTWVGLAVGWQARPGLRLGAALQGAYASSTSVVDLDTSLTTTSADPIQQGAHLNVSIRSDETALAGRLLLGLQWDVGPSLRLALAVRSPSSRVKAWGTTTRLISVSALLPGYGPQVQQALQTTHPAGGLSVVDTGRLSGGLRWDLDPWSLRLDGDWSPALERASGGAQEAWNLRAGALYRASEALVLGGGAFREGARSVASQGRLAVDAYGLTAGVSYRPAKVERTPGGGRSWDLLTGIAGRVAYGTGLGPGITVVPFQLSASHLPILFGDPDNGYLEVPARTLEASLHVFTTLSF